MTAAPAAREPEFGPSESLACVGDGSMDCSFKAGTPPGADRIAVHCDPAARARPLQGKLQAYCTAHERTNPRGDLIKTLNTCKPGPECRTTTQGGSVGQLLKWRFLRFLTPLAGQLQ